MTKLTDEDKEWIRLIGREIAFAVFNEALPAHEAMCPHGQKLVKMKWLMIGIGIGIPLASAGLVAAAIKLFPAFAAAL
ncbi:MAG TPA: hypothetical protein VM223_05480 [Planctomycetota bacterium]|nr:hypothetical protein [Planctomycetota bacterium]